MDSELKIQGLNPGTTADVVVAEVSFLTAWVYNTKLSYSQKLMAKVIFTLNYYNNRSYHGNK